MPSIPQSIALKERYGVKNKISLKELKSLNENFRLSTQEITKAFSFQGLDQSIIPFFESQQSVNLIMLFIDITAFSSKCKTFSNSRLATYLDDYYNCVIPIIYTHGGEIERIMGDGIIAVFGSPYLSDSKNSLFEKADKCAKDIILLLWNSDKEVKVALHDGNIMYYKNKSLNFPEYTIIGRPLTELYRLETVAKNNSVSYYHISEFDKKEFSKDGSYCISNKSPIRCGSFSKSEAQSVNLPGVDWSFIKHFTCTYATL